MFCTDPHVPDESLTPIDDVIAHSDLLIVAAPHVEYRDLHFREGQLVVDIWNTYGKGTMLAGDASLPNPWAASAVAGDG